MPVKWVDNVLSQNRIDGVVRLRQGVARRLAPRAVVTLDIALRLSEALGASISAALAIAAKLLQQREHEFMEIGQGLRLSVDISRIEADVMDRLANAVEIAPSPRRGRPPRSF
jgi:hypothetical protein